MRELASRRPTVRGERWGTDSGSGHVAAAERQHRRARRGRQRDAVVADAVPQRELALAAALVVVGLDHPALAGRWRLDPVERAVLHDRGDVLLRLPLVADTE